MKLTRLFLIGVTLAAFLLVGIESGFAGTKKHHLKLAQASYPAPSKQQDAIDRLAKNITERTNGRITFTVYGTELADWVELDEMVMRGSIDMELNPQSTTYDPRLNIVYAPYIVSTYEEAKKFYGPGGFMDKMFRRWAVDRNKFWLGTWFQGFAGVSLSKRGAKTPEEAKGIKIRVPPVAAFECYWKKLGFTPSLIPYSEVPTAISTGIVDGQAGGGPFQTWSCCRDLNKYFVWYLDYLESWAFTINLDKWKEIEPDDQKIIQEAVDEEVLRRIEGAEKEDRQYLKKLADYGLTVVDMTKHPKLLADARDRGRACWPIMDNLVGKVWMDQVRKAVGMPIK